MEVRLKESTAAPRPDRLLAECDVETYRGSGPGGQHRNRRDSAVRLTHRPTGIVVTATERRSQHQNKEVALERLAAKLAARNRRKRPRIATKPSRRAAERRLKTKTLRAFVKVGRRGEPAGDD